ncbi:MAG: glycine cleavage system protein GcvH [Candidatus Omnitrophota bacterium]
MNIPADLKYTATHEWSQKQGKKLRVGITEFAQKEISDIVFVELPAAGKAVEKGRPAAVVESVKAAFDIYAPVSGKITAVNPALESDPGTINRDAYGAGWMFEIEMSAPGEWDQLLSAGDYQKTLEAGKK